MQLGQSLEASSLSLEFGSPTAEPFCMTWRLPLHQQVHRSGPEETDWLGDDDYQNNKIWVYSPEERKQGGPVLDAWGKSPGRGTLEPILAAASSPWQRHQQLCPNQKSVADTISSVVDNNKLVCSRRTIPFAKREDRSHNHSKRQQPTGNCFFYVPRPETSWDLRKQDSQWSTSGQHHGVFSNILRVGMMLP